MSGSILTQIYVEEKKREWEKNEKDSMKVTEKNNTGSDNI